MTPAPLTTHCDDTFPDDALPPDDALYTPWRRIIPPDDALWRHIPWRRIAPWRRITPWRHIVTTHSLTTHCPLMTHYPVTPHCDDAGPSSKLVNWAIPQQPLPKRTASCGRRERRVFVTSPERLVAGVEKCSNMFSSNLYYQWPWKAMHLSMWQSSPWKKLANGHMAPLCGTSGSHSAAGIVSVSSIQWLGGLANEFAMVSSI